MTNTNDRGSTTDRRRRKTWLLETFGDGTTAPCSFECGEVLTWDTLTVDRYPIAGADGGTYKRDNIRPACRKCNVSDGMHIKIRKKAERTAASQLEIDGPPVVS